MTKKHPTTPTTGTTTKPRREDSLSRERIIEAAIEILDSSGESGLTFRTLAEKLATGAGAIYWHIPNKGELLTAACDAIVARTIAAHIADTDPKATIRTLALGMFDAIDSHPWVGPALIRAAGQLPMVRILERIGQQICALGVPAEQQWAATSALLHYILGVAGLDSANTLSQPPEASDRAAFLGGVATLWSQLDADEYPFARSVAGQLREHDDREDFLAGVELILRGIAASKEHPPR